MSQLNTFLTAVLRRSDARVAPFDGKETSTDKRMAELLDLWNESGEVVIKTQAKTTKPRKKKTTVVVTPLASASSSLEY